MSGRQRVIFGAPADSVLNMACPAAHQPGCSLRTAALHTGPGTNGLKEWMTECEINIFVSLARDDRIAVRDHETGALWGGLVDIPFPDQGFVWVITDAGERKLLDIGVHTIWRPEESGLSGSVHWEACRLENDRAPSMASGLSD